MKTFENLSKFLKDSRLKKGIGRAELARNLGIGIQYIVNWEQEQCAPPLKKLSKLIEALDITPEQAVEAMLEDERAVIEAKVFAT